MRWNIWSISSGDSFSPRSSHQRRSESRLPDNAEARAASSRCGTFVRRPDSCEAAFDAAGKVALGQVEEVFEVAGVGEHAVELVLVADVRKEFGDRHHAMRSVFAITERVAHGFKERLQLADEQVVFVAVVEVKGGAADARPVENVLYGDVVDGLLDDEVEQRGAQLQARAADAGIRSPHREGLDGG